MQEYSQLSVLIVDPNLGMRASVQDMLNQSGVTRIDYAVSAGIAIGLLRRQSFDIILCEYELGGQEGQDGQQLLEDLRQHKLIGELTIFIMLTAESGHARVLGAAELKPTDYILKPFTLRVLSERIERALERRAIFLPVHQMIAKGNVREAITMCGAAGRRHPRHVAEFARLRAELHQGLGEAVQAGQLYHAILSTRPVGWAHLGLAGSLFQQQRYDEAQDTLSKLVQQNPVYMDAYDMLVQTHEAMGQTAQAKKLLEDAVGISPHKVRRLRRLGQVSLETGDIAAAERAFRNVVEKARHSTFRDPEDHVNLVKTLVRKGDAGQAGAILRDLERSLRGHAHTEVCRAISAALLLESEGNKAASARELDLAASAVGSSPGLSSQLKIGLVHSCLENRRDASASLVMLAMMNEADSGMSMEQAVAVFEKAGRHDLAQGMDAQVKSQVQELMLAASEKSNQGDHRSAVTALAQALRRMPANLQLLLASVTAIFRHLDELGWEAALAEQCQAQLQTLLHLDATPPLLDSLRQQYAAIRRKYGIS